MILSTGTTYVGINTRRKPAAFAFDYLPRQVFYHSRMRLEILCTGKHGAFTLYVWQKRVFFISVNITNDTSINWTSLSILCQSS